MSYQVLARKWRPKSFETLVGQEHVVRALSNALDQQRLHHAYLFTGTRGVGKTTLSRILAKSLNCETGVTSKPCGVCSACVAIDKGSFIDYVELDAASNRGVDDMTALLEKAVYAPTQGRYKVYMLDEVHQLTGHAFNAMLKTLEEPPAHVKFILATTDPQKVPVTVLSRCLQFNLRQMAGTAISDHLQSILGQENIPFDALALHLIARAANGSMRDALSLLDQAIAYGGSAVKEQEVRSMLGAIDQSYLFDLLDTLVAQDGTKLMEYARQMEQRSLSFEAALGDLANLLYQIAVCQSAPNSLAHDLPDHQRLMGLAGKLSAEQVQLFYQIALLGRRDIGLAPDEFAGFTMCLLRMLAFIPVDTPATPKKEKQTHTTTAVPTLSALTAKEANAATQPSAIEQPAILNAQDTTLVAKAETPEQPPLIADAIASDAPSFDGNWRSLVDRLKLGLARALAQNCELLSHDAHNFYLSVPEAHKHLLGESYQEKLHAALAQYFGTKIKLHFTVGGTGNTPAAQISQEKAEVQSAAESAIREDDFVQALVKDFGAQIIPSSIKPIQ
ncbi:MAG: DNA polymerase III subunit gamma/tau [Methylophilaceae bacterium]|nr:DNA polymerase III subunit gamma/tau [Methylophilaceae bacterium]